MNQFGISEELFGAISGFCSVVNYVLKHVPSYQRMINSCFALKLQKFFVYTFSNFPSVWGSVDPLRLVITLD